MKAPNPNILWAQIFVDELARTGLRAACIAPGSRSTPLIIAFSEHPDITVHSLLDERSAAFFALGIALASGQPAALVCTSGTAAANFYPTIVEANYSHLPLLVLTADRPHELRDSGSNQAIDQIKMYGDHVRWFVDVALPETNPTPKSLRSLRTLACRAMATALGAPPGPVHLNFPFRKPLEPTPLPGFEPPSQLWEREDGTPFTQFTRGGVWPVEGQLEPLIEAVQRARRRLIICGPRRQGDSFPNVVAHLSQRTGFPILADALSGVRFGEQVGLDGVLILGAYETSFDSRIISELQPPDVILHFGASPTSKVLNGYLENLPLETRRFSIQEHGDWRDDTHTTSDLIWADPQVTCACLLARLQSAPPDFNWNAALKETEARAWDAFDTAREEIYFEGAILADVVELLPPNALLFVASSLPVRHLDQFVRPRQKPLWVFANRGASGIDGTISSALGAATTTEKPLVLVTGDLAFYHDLNGLLALERWPNKNSGVKATIVLINNNGGGIFHRLPIADFDPPFTDLVLTPHGLDFEPVVRMFGAGYRRVTAREDFRYALQDAIEAENSQVIEFPTNSVLHEKMRKMILEMVSDQVKKN